MPFIYADAEKIYKKNTELKKENVKHLEEWMDKQPHLPKVTEIDVIFFLHSCYYSIEKAKTAIENYYTSKTASPEVFGAKDPIEFQETLNQIAYVPLPELTPEGYQVIFCQIVQCEPSQFNFHNHIKYIDGSMKMWFLERGPPDGVVIVLDMNGFLFGHLTKIPIMSIKKLMFYLQEGLPVRLKSVHVINTIPLIEKVLAVIKPFMKTELINILHFHGSNLETLYKYVPKALLPNDFGGKVESVSKLHEANVKRINDGIDFFKIEESTWADESKRQNKSAGNNAMFGIEGSFKRLEID